MNAAEELSEITEATAQLRARLQDKALKEPIGALREACKQVARAWSGSNIGYHATVYFADFLPKPPEAQFSAEWGLEERWPTHQPHSGWRIMDREALSWMRLFPERVVPTQAFLRESVGLARSRLGNGE